MCIKLNITNIKQHEITLITSIRYYDSLVRYGKEGNRTLHSYLIILSMTRPRHGPTTRIGREIGPRPETHLPITVLLMTGDLKGMY